MRRGKAGMTLVPKSRYRLHTVVLEVMTLGARGSLGQQGSRRTQWAPGRRKSTKFS